MRVCKIQLVGGTRIEVPEGSWIQPIRTGYIFECCECGLKHRLDFRIAKRRVQFRAWRVPKRQRQARAR